MCHLKGMKSVHQTKTNRAVSITLLDMEICCKLQSDFLVFFWDHKTQSELSPQSASLHKSIQTHGFLHHKLLNTLFCLVPSPVPSCIYSLLIYKCPHCLYRLHTCPMWPTEFQEVQDENHNQCGDIFLTDKD